VNCRLETLRRWERAWAVLRARDMPGPAAKSSLRYAICDTFLTGVNALRTPGYSLSFDLRPHFVVVSGK